MRRIFESKRRVLKCAVSFGSIEFSENKTPKKTTQGYSRMESTSKASQIFKNLQNRSRINKNVTEFSQACKETNSERAASRVTGIPRSTAQYHAKRHSQIELDETVLEFFCSNPGMTFLNQLVLAIEFVMSQLGHCGVRLIQCLYELSHLDRLVACSTGTLSGRIKQMESNMIDYGEQQEVQLVKSMPTDKTITCCLDETFPSGICLVAMEPVSNFILLEEMAARRDAATWADAMDKRLENLPVTVAQVTSDGAKALIKYTEQHLGAHHSPDLFHVQQEISRASSAPLRAKVKQAQSVADKSASALETAVEERVIYESQAEKPIGRPKDFIGRQAIAEVEHEFAVEELERTRSRQEQVGEANKALGEIYHPFKLDSGCKRSAGQLRSELNEKFGLIETSLEQADVSENSLKRVEKARRVTDSMVSTLQFFWVMVDSQLKRLALGDLLEEVFMRLVLPAIYLEVHAAKASTAEQRKELKSQSDQLYQQLGENNDWQALPESRKNELQKTARECAHTFQRSSSNVEGRNGQLALHHHTYKNMNQRKLRASTVIHNYFIRRDDGTTAAERFFGKAPKSLFQHLLAVTDYPAAPAKKRSAVRILNAAA